MNKVTLTITGPSSQEGKAWEKTLANMYEAWAKRNEAQCDQQAMPDGVVLTMQGKYLDGLGLEHGIHRQMRKSPFDSQGRRFTVFAQVIVGALPKSDEVIRSYAFDPYQLVTDHRTNAQVRDLNAVLDGDFGDLWQLRAGAGAGN